MFQGFKKFILRGNAVDLAVGVVIGAAFSGIINSLVTDLLTPLIGAVSQLPDFSSWFFTINGSKFLIGSFLNQLLSFLIMAATVYYFVVLPLNTLVARTRKDAPAEPDTKKCPECLSIIPRQAKRCAFCTSLLPPLKKA